MEIRFYSFVRPDGSIYTSTKQLSPVDKPIQTITDKKNTSAQKSILTSEELEYLQNSKSTDSQILIKIIKYLEDNIKN